MGKRSVAFWICVAIAALWLAGAGIVTDAQTNLPQTSGRAIACDQAAQINFAAAGGPTELVALTANKSIRVCAFVVVASGAGTFKFQRGTGSNCGTGTADVVPVMTLATGVPINHGSGYGQLFPVTVSNALCATTTGAVQVSGFVTYTKF